jgi:DNA-binding NarL/FixJ family response regulator
LFAGSFARDEQPSRFGRQGKELAMRVVLAEDNLLVREGVRRLLAQEDDIQVVASCASLDELLVSVRTDDPDVVLTDIRMPPTGTDEGIQAAARLRQTNPAIGVVVLSQYDDPAYALALLDGGSAGRAYLLKERVSEPAQLVTALREVARGGSVIDPRVVEALVAARVEAKESALRWLTAREREVLEQMAQGKSNAAIADTLCLTIRAVEKHINAIFAKLPLAQQPEIDRRVKAVLLFLAERG